MLATERRSISISSQDDGDNVDSAEARLSLLARFAAVCNYLPPSRWSLNKATLSHWDLRTPNIFVEGGRITSLIDWQDVWVGPLFMQERRPPLIDYREKIILRLPENYEAMKNKQEKAKLAQKVEKSILCWVYGRRTQKENPNLQELFDLPLARTRWEAVLYASDIWNGETTPLREYLYTLQR